MRFNKALTAAAIKVTALVAMLSDHLATVIIGRMINAGAYDASAFIWKLYGFLRAFGRIAFPLYCFLLVEGFYKAHDIKRYIKRMLLLALISEIPYNLCFSAVLFEKRAGNVFFTLALGLVTMEAVFRIKCALEEKLNIVYIFALQLLATAAVCGLAYLIDCDYSYKGIIIIMTMYFFRNEGIAFFLGSGLAMILFLREPAALCSLLFLLFYNGEKGKQGKMFFYSFYPVHLILLYAVSALMGLAGVVPYMS